MRIKTKETKDGVTTIKTESGHTIIMPEQNEMPPSSPVKTQVEILSDKIDQLEAKIDALKISKAGV